MRSLGMDLGFYQVKLVGQLDNKVQGKKFTSIIGYPSAIELSNQETDACEDNLYLTDQGRTYYIGEKAIRDTSNAQLTFIADKTDKASDRIKYLSGLGIALEKANYGAFNIVTGLPVDEFAGLQGLKEKLEHNMKGTFDYVFGSRKIRVTVPTVTVIPQSAGAYYDYILDVDGGIKKERVNPKTVVIDIGYRTTDVVTLSNAKYSPTESFTVNVGVSDIHKEVKKLLLREYRLTKELEEIDSIVRSKQIVLGGKSISVEHIIEAAAQPFVEKILSTLPVYISNLREVHQLLVTGGGAYLMYRTIHQEYHREIPIDHMEESEFSNARGYYKYALFLAQNRRD